MSEKSPSIRGSRTSVNVPIQREHATAVTAPSAYGPAPEYPSAKKRMIIMLGLYLSFFLITLVCLLHLFHCQRRVSNSIVSIYLDSFSDYH
jgi:hypothetical protein